MTLSAMIIECEQFIYLFVMFVGFYFQVIAAIIYMHMYQALSFILREQLFILFFTVCAPLQWYDISS